MKKIMTVAAAAAFSMAITFSAYATDTPNPAGSTYNFAKTATLEGEEKNAEGGRWDKYGNDFIYKFDHGGWANSCWLQIECNGVPEWFHFSGGSVMETGWIQENGNWYYLCTDENDVLGKMHTGWQYINGNWYYFCEDGTFKGMLLQNAQTPDGYMVDEQGIRIE